MAFLDKLGKIAKSTGEAVGGFARTASDRTSDAIEIGRINGRIRDQKKAIEELIVQIGEYYWTSYQNGMVLDADAAALCEQIVSANAEIESMQAQIQAIKDENSNKTVINPDKEETVEAAPAANRFCTACGKPIEEDQKFCGHCGAAQ